MLNSNNPFRDAQDARPPYSPPASRQEEGYNENHSTHAPPPAYTPSAYEQREGAHETYNSEAPFPADSKSYAPPVGPPPSSSNPQLTPQAQYQNERGFGSPQAPVDQPIYLGAPGEAQQERGFSGMGNNNAIRVPAGSPTVWSRPPPPHFSYQPFAPIDLQGHRDLSQGFPHMPPPSNEQPHPFASHDVCQVDWEWFLGDLKWEAMRLDTQEGHSEAPRETRRPHPRGLIGVAISLAVGAATASSSKPTTNPMAVNVNSCAQRVDQWNQYFFNPRRMQVVLVKGRAARGRSSSRDSSSSSSSNDSGRRSHRRSGTSNRLERKLERIEERHQRRMAKLARREERREERRERRARRRGQLGADEGRYEGREESHKVWWVSVVPV